ncbi:16S rRNA (uracil(1498)-N(3))-methyltransferase [Schaalia sp. Marseille-Q2122]|uniref:16S rRNA (uracil(1498)-N(3))-methyltransferase n=1 Tax=Schaalia sp. Marseille-Q2122 TaxID=2736604 RepID=UPI00158CA36B|nr:16S rRNA (uracil(1498)-N(3))-methyltransferase [Schaalia sp. Marseille-Q2122]
MTLPVFLGHEATPALDTLRVGDSVELGGDEGRHAAKVRRMQVGERLDLVNGRGLRVRGVVDTLGGAALTLRVEAVTSEVPPAPTLILVQALAKGGRDEQAVESATEIGVDRVLPWQANRSIVKWVGSKAERARAKWVALTEAAAKQSRRAWVPVVESAADSKALARWVEQLVAGGGVCFVCHEEGSDTLTDYLRDNAQVGEATSIAVVIGPEGGIDEGELAALREAGAAVVLLGPHVLRSSSAGAAALTLVSAATGRW